MKRAMVLAGLVLIGGASMLAAGRQRPQVNLEITNVRENLWVITGGGGNTGVYVAEKGVVLVDTKLPGMGPGIIEKVKSVTDKPVMMVINTHTHGDHNGSNSAFTGSVEFIAHENCKTSMEKMPAFQSEEGKKFLPGRTYKTKLSVLGGKEKIDLYHFGPGHTNGDTFVVFTGLRTVHTGDLFPGKMTPFIDTGNGGDPLTYPVTLKKAAAGISGVDTVIPGHSAVTDWNAFREFGDFVGEMVAVVTKAKKEGQTADQAIESFKLPEKFKDYNLGRIKDDVTKIHAALK
ncbi:MAG: MBL fold metallo-hydrolase [Acidobacteriota bacterium]|nr:MAG: MBL fold metallo-hydrolase [Acidobacteriota bacterium]